MDWTGPKIYWINERAQIELNYRIRLPSLFIYNMPYLIFSNGHVIRNIRENGWFNEISSGSLSTSASL